MIHGDNLAPSPINSGFDLTNGFCGMTSPCSSHSSLSLHMDKRKKNVEGENDWAGHVID